jgi:hypothetical protein
VKDKIILALFVLFLSRAAFAQLRGDKEGWELNLKKISLNLTTTQVKNSKTYKDFSDSRLSADNQTMVQGYFDFTANYYRPMYLWSNDFLAQYGKTTVKPEQGQETSTENVDQMLFTTDISYRLWHIDKFSGGFDLGPFANTAYETELTSNSDSPRKKTLRHRAGAKAFEGLYLKSFYLAGVAEEDFTYPRVSYNLAWESGLKIEHQIREGVKGQYSLTFRDYLNSSEKRPTDLDYQLEADARMDVLVFKNFALAPFINYYIVRGKYVSGLGRNLNIGISFSFSRLFKEAKNV